VTKSRAPIWLLIAAFAVGQAAALVHGLETRHVRCAEHGEWIDVPWTTAPSDGDRDARVAVHGEAGAIDADHCIFGDHARVVTAPSAVALAAVELVRLDLTTALAARCVPVASPLRFAPKTSPPA
jgi:hypothetical protein